MSEIEFNFYADHDTWALPLHIRWKNDPMFFYIVVHVLCFSFVAERWKRQ